MNYEKPELIVYEDLTVNTGQLQKISGFIGPEL